MTFRFWNNQEKLAPAETNRMLPFDVRYAMQYKEAKLGPSEILDLANNRLEHEGLYLLLKAVSTSLDKQVELLDALVQTVKDVEENTSVDEVLQAFVKQHVPDLPTDATADSMKLAQYSRQGFELWRSKFAETARLAAERDNPTYLVGHSMFMGLAEYVIEHAKVNKPLHILMPHLVEDADNSFCGYAIIDNDTLLLAKDFVRESNAIITDDVRNTGETEQTVRTFWNQGATDTGLEFEYVSTITN
jgi:hypothetical protein